MHTPVAYGQWSVFDHNGDNHWRSSGQDMGFGGLGMSNSKSGDYNFFSSG